MVVYVVAWAFVRPWSGGIVAQHGLRFTLPLRRRGFPVRRRFPVIPRLPDPPALSGPMRSSRATDAAWIVSVTTE